jgi:hypothetical protein
VSPPQTASNPQARRPSSLLTRPQQPILLNKPPHLPLLVALFLKKKQSRPLLWDFGSQNQPRRHPSDGVSTSTSPANHRPADPTHHLQ